MIPFHKIYLKLFSSLDFDIERNLLNDFKKQEIWKFLSIKRSWIYALKLSFIIIFAVLLLVINSILGVTYFEHFLGAVLIPASFMIVSIFLLSDTLWYMYVYKKTHMQPFIETNIDLIIERNERVNKNFIRFFNISIFTSILLLITLLEALIFILFFYNGDYIYIIFIEIFLTIAASILVVKHRRLSMNLELDFWFVIPWYVYVIDQTWLLSSKQSIMWQNIKTVEGVYTWLLGSLLWYGDIKIYLEGNMPHEKGVITLDYIRNPRKTVDHINNILELWT